MASEPETISFSSWQHNLGSFLSGHGCDIQTINFNKLLNYTTYEGIQITKDESSKLLSFIKKKNKQYVIGCNVDSKSEKINFLCYDVALELTTFGYIQYFDQVLEIPFWTEGVIRKLTDETTTSAAILQNKLAREAKKKKVSLKKMCLSLMFSCGSKQITMTSSKAEK
eukprot:508246_1